MGGVRRCFPPFCPTAIRFCSTRHNKIFLYIPAFVSFFAGTGGGGWCRCFRNPRGSPLHGWVRWGTGAGRRRVTRKREIHSSKRSEMQLQSPPRLVSLPACLLGAPTTAVKSTRRAGPWTQLLASPPTPPTHPQKGSPGPGGAAPGLAQGAWASSRARGERVPPRREPGRRRVPAPRTPTGVRGEGGRARDSAAQRRPRFGQPAPSRRVKKSDVIALEE